MKVNKIFGVKSITNLIYGMLLLLPMVSILSRVIYTQSNPNSLDSYSEKYTKKEVSITSSNVDTLYIDNQIITLRWNDNAYGSRSGLFGFSAISLDLNSLLNTSNITYTAFEFYTSSTNWIYFFDENGTQYTIYDYKSKFNGFTYTIDLSTYTRKSIYSYAAAYIIDYTTKSLDNSFEYSLSTFLDDYDNQGIDFFSWFTDLFLNQSNHHNALYLNFCNWYMNYVLLVSSAYLLFFALMWFINYIRKLLEKSSYHDFGGF